MPTPDIRVLDRETGKIVRVGDTEYGVYDLSEWDWEEGNWSCDCNRARVHGLASTYDANCDGQNRFVVVDESGRVIPEYNDGYRDVYHPWLSATYEAFPGGHDPYLATGDNEHRHPPADQDHDPAGGSAEPPAGPAPAAG